MMVAIMVVKLVMMVVIKVVGKSGENGGGCDNVP